MSTSSNNPEPHHPAKQGGSSSADLTRSVLSWVISIVLHLALIFVLYNTVAWVIEKTKPEESISVRLVEGAPRTLQKEASGGGNEEQEETSPPTPEEQAPVEKTPEVDKGKDEALPGGREETSVAMLAPGSVGQNQQEAFSLRSVGGRKLAISKGGGSLASENAVEAGLRWLQAHQDEDGKWDCAGFSKHCPPDDKCEGAGSSLSFRSPFDIGVTGLSTLAFLGAGYTHRQGKYKEEVDSALRYLLRLQRAEGAFSAGTIAFMYNHAIATLAIAEAYAMTHDKRLKLPLEQAVAFIASAQQAQGGWNYTPQPSDRNDMSVTGWVVMVIHSAGYAGVKVPPETLYKLVTYLDRYTSPDGYMQYTSRDKRYGIALTAVGMLSREYLGWPRTSSVLVKQARLLRSEPPGWGRLINPGETLHSMYYWYYGTLAMHGMGGDDWAFWNQQIRDMLIEHQCRQGHRQGSWDPIGMWGRYGGRVYSTALNILNLEIYYRFLPLYQQRESQEVVGLLAQGLSRQTSREERLRLVKDIADFYTPEASQALGKALQDEDLFVRFQAARELARRGEGEAVPVLAQLLQDDNSFLRAQAVAALAEVRRPQAVDALFEALDDEQAFIARKAASSIGELTGRQLPFDPESPNKEETVRKWKDWWNQARKVVPKALSGKVLAVRQMPKGGEFVIVDLGGRQNLNPGQLLDLVRAGVVIGTLRVERVYQRMADARVEQMHIKTKVKPGDRVVTSSAETN